VDEEADLVDQHLSSERCGVSVKPSSETDIK
jgi:hypothetical protein